MDQWLVRTSSNWIAGPYLKSQVIEMIKNGQITLDDEICPGGGYWIYLHEREEMLQHLGIECPRRMRSANDEDEITEIQIPPPQEDPTDTGVVMGPGRGHHSAPTHASADSPENSGDATAMISRPGSVKPPEYHEEESPPSPPPPSYYYQTVSKPLPRVQTVGQVERSSFWRGFAWFLLVTFLVFGVAIVRLLKY